MTHIRRSAINTRNLVRGICMSIVASVNPLYRSTTDAVCIIQNNAIIGFLRSPLYLLAVHVNYLCIINASDVIIPTPCVMSCAWTLVTTYCFRVEREKSWLQMLVPYVDLHTAAHCSWVLQGLRWGGQWDRGSGACMHLACIVLVKVQTVWFLVIHRFLVEIKYWGQVFTKSFVYMWLVLWYFKVFQ